MAKLTPFQEHMLLYKHCTGDFPAGTNRGPAIDRLLHEGYLEETESRLLRVTPKGRAYCDERHLSIQF